METASTARLKIFTLLCVRHVYSLEIDTTSCRLSQPGFLNRLQEKSSHTDIADWLN
jgi:hypothetical protein